MLREGIEFFLLCKFGLESILVECRSGDGWELESSGMHVGSDGWEHFSVKIPGGMLKYLQMAAMPLFLVQAGLEVLLVVVKVLLVVVYLDKLAATVARRADVSELERRAHAGTAFMLAHRLR